MSRSAWMLVALMLTSIGIGVCIERPSIVGGISLGIVAAVVAVDLFLDYRRNASAAKKWREHRHKVLEELVAKHLERAWADYTTKTNGGARTDSDATRIEAEARQSALIELSDLLGPN